MKLSREDIAFPLNAREYVKRFGCFANLNFFAIAP
jgi:hypothetical protein